MIKASELEKKEIESMVMDKEFRMRRQRVALSSVLGKRWREDQEAVSAAFSKWVMFTMFDEALKNKESAESLRSEQRELDKSRKDLESRRQELSTLERKVENASGDLQIQIEQIKRAETRLKAAEAEFVQRNQYSELEIASARAALEKERAELEKERTSLSDAKEILMAKRKEREEMESSRKPDETHATSAQGRAFSKILDQTLEEERGWMQQAAEAIAQREAQVDRKGAQLLKLEHELKEKEARLNADLRDFQQAQVRIRNLTDQLRQKEAEMKERENMVGVKLQECQDARHRVQKLALQLQAKEEGLERDRKRISERMDECDAVESQLRVWQDELERSATRQDG
jgi:chromosome segregation ATPase